MACLLFIFIFSITIGIVPTIIAYKRNHNNAGPILIFNLFFGWTVLGWVIALIWSLTDNISHEN